MAINMQNVLEEFISNSIEDTKNFALSFSSNLKKGSIVVFLGDLGVGKTTFIKALTKRFSEDRVTSPTFNYLNVYKGKIDIYHFDLYRIKDKNQFFNMGFDEYFNKGICLIEWGEKILSDLPEKTKIIHLIHADVENQRKIVTLKL